MRRPKRFYSTLAPALVMAALLTGWTTPAMAAPAKEAKSTAAGPATKISIDFNDADIKLYIKFMADLTGRNFIIDEKVKGKVTIISPKKVTVDEAMKVFESTLEVYGYALIEAGNITKVVPATEARQRGPFSPEQPGDRVLTRLIPLQYVKAAEMVNILRPLIPVSGFISAYNGTNTLIIVDYASNVEKIFGIISQLDVPGQEEVVTVVQLTYAGAKKLAERLKKIFGKDRSTASSVRRTKAAAKAKSRVSAVAGQASRAAQIIADERINSLIIVANKPQTDQLLSLIEQLDIPAPPGQGKINVYYLKNADAEELARVLNNITKGTGKRTSKKMTARAMQLRSGVTVTPDKASNALVITASREDYLTLKEVIEKLDRRRKQVFVEALIMEITTDKTREFGVEWRTTSDFTKEGKKAIGGTDFGNINAVAENPLNAPQGLTIGVVDGLITFAGQDFLNLGALIHALQAETGINILSTPNILTTDNKEAEIVVAENVPFVTGEAQNTGGTTLTTIERRNIGLTLRITPQISEANIVKLDVYQEISSISTTQLEKAQDLITFTRSVKTTVVVSDGQNIVIGGLIRDNLNDSESKVPILGDIPILGWLFKSTSKRKQKTNLLVFLTPHIIHNDKDIADITDRQNEILQMNPSSHLAEFESAITEHNQEKPDPDVKQDDTADNDPSSFDVEE